MRIEPGQGGYRILCWTLMGLLLLRPLIYEFSAQPWLLPTFSTVVLLAGVWAVSRNRRQVIALAFLALIALGGVWGQVISASNLRDGLSFVAATAYFTWIAVVLSLDVFKRSKTVSSDMIYGGINVYLLTGMAFAAAFAAQANLDPGSIQGLGAAITYSDTIYFSFVTLTTLGYGDILPVSENARMLAVVEALLGQLYVAILLARLVAVHITGANSSD